MGGQSLQHSQREGAAAGSALQHLGPRLALGEGGLQVLHELDAVAVDRVDVLDGVVL